MVRIEKNKIVIEIETKNPIDDLTTYQRALIDAMKQYKADEGDNMDCTNFFLGDLLKELLPTFDQTKELYLAVMN